MRKLTTRLDGAVRREENEYSTGNTAASTDDIFSIRARADYQLRRNVTVYGGVEYEKESSDEVSSYEFDRYRGSLGLNFRY